MKSWYLWLQNRGASGRSAPGLTCEKFRPLLSVDFQEEWGVQVGALHYWERGTSRKYFVEGEVAAFSTSALPMLVEPTRLEEFDRIGRRRARQLDGAASRLGQAAEGDWTNSLDRFARSYHALSLSSVPLILLAPGLELRIDARIEELLGTWNAPLELGAACRSRLTLPRQPSWAQRAREERRPILTAIQADPAALALFQQPDDETILEELPSFPLLMGRIEGYRRSWKWLPYKWIGPELTLEALLSELRRELREKERPHTVVHEELREEVRNLCSKLTADDELGAHCHLLSRLIALKEYESGLVSRSSWSYGHFRQRVARRFDFEPALTEQMLFQDFRDLLATRSCPEDELRGRQELFLWLAGGRERFAVGAEARRIIQQELGESRSMRDLAVLRGTVASPGKVMGPVLKASDLSAAIARAGEGFVLAAYRTTEAYMPIIAKARAILTSEHGLTQHATQVAADFGLPCIVGIEGLMDALEDGELVEVDATLGRVNRLDVASAGGAT